MHYIKFFDLTRKWSIISMTLHLKINAYFGEMNYGQNFKNRSKRTSFF